MPHGVYEPGIRKTLKGPSRLRELAEKWMLSNALAVHVFFNSEAPLVQSVAPRAEILISATGTVREELTWAAVGLHRVVRAL
jgi:hypothetical protein